MWKRVQERESAPPLDAGGVLCDAPAPSLLRGFQERDPSARLRRSHVVRRVQLAVSSASGGGSLAGGHDRRRRLKGRSQTGSYLSYAALHVTAAVTQSRLKG